MLIVGYCYCQWICDQYSVSYTLQDSSWGTCVWYSCVAIALHIQSKADEHYIRATNSKQIFNWTTMSIPCCSNLSHPNLIQRRISFVVTLPHAARSRVTDVQPVLCTKHRILPNISRSPTVLVDMLLRTREFILPVTLQVVGMLAGAALVLHPAGNNRYWNVIELARLNEMVPMITVWQVSWEGNAGNCGR